MDAYFSIAPDRRSALFASDSGGKGLCDLFSVVLPETLKQLKTADSLKAALLAQASLRQNEAVVQTDSGGLPYMAGVPKRSTDVITGYADTAFVKALRDEIEALKAENNRLKNERRPGQKSEEEAVIEKRPEAERKQYTELLYRAYPKLTATYTVHFPFNKWDVKPGEEQTMTRLLEYLKLRPGANLFVYGHTDNVGTVEVNDQISALRGEAIKAWLERNGIESERIRSIGKGLFFPVAGNATAAGRKKNRRTDVEIREK